MSDNGPQIRAIDAPESWAAWPDDRVQCQDCGHRSGFMCIAFRMPTHPLELRHRCERHARKVMRRAA